MLGWAIRAVFLVGLVGVGGYFMLSGLEQVQAPEMGAKTTRSSAPTQDSDTGGDRTYELRANKKGQYWVKARVNGADVTFMVDTGATDVMLDMRAAEAAGLRPRRHDFTKEYHTANGIVRAAPVTLREIRIGPIQLHDVPAVVNEVDMGGMSLLGMGYLKRLEGFESRKGRLILKW